MTSFSCFSDHKRKQRGFTLVEMLVVLFILGGIAALLLFNTSNARDQAGLQDAAQTVTQAIHEAQTDALAGKEFIDLAGSCPTGPNNCFGVMYGVFVQNGGPMVIFADTSGNGIYNFAPPGPSCTNADTQCVRKITLDNGYSIDTISNDGTASTFANISFSESNNTGPQIKSTCSTPPCPSFNSTTITIKSPAGKKATITIDRTGKPVIKYL